MKIGAPCVELSTSFESRRDCCFLLEKKRDFTVQRLLAMTRPWQVDAPDKARQKHPSRAPLARRKTSVECPQCKNHFLPESISQHICPNAPMGSNLCALPFYRSSSQSWDKMTSRESLARRSQGRSPDSNESCKGRSDQNWVGRQTPPLGPPRVPIVPTAGGRGVCRGRNFNGNSPFPRNRT